MDQSIENYRVIISGSYGGLNMGDEAILQSIITQLRLSLPVEITVLTRDAEDTQRRHDVDRAVQVHDLSRSEVSEAIAGQDLFILGGGGILFDKWVREYLRFARSAEEQGVPLMTYGIGAGPLTDAAARDAVRDCLNRAVAVTVREKSALHVLEEVGVNREIKVTADPALLLEPEPLPEDTMKREGLDGSRPLIGMSVREPGPAAPDLDVGHYHAILANAADFMVDRFNADLIFIPMEPQKLDAKHSHGVIAQMHQAQRATVLKGEYSSRQLLSLIGQLDFAVGMRLHFLIFSALKRVPFVALPYAGKVSGFLQELEMETAPLNDVNAGRLIAHIDRAWDCRSEQRAQIDRLLPGLQERARETNRIAVEWLKRGRGRPEPADAVPQEA